MMLSDVCLSVVYIVPKSRTERPRKTKIGTEVAHVTRDSDTTFKVKGQILQAALLTAVLAHQAVAVVGVGMCWLWETCATLPSAHKGVNGWGILWRPPAYSLLDMQPLLNLRWWQSPGGSTGMVVMRSVI